MRRYYFDHAATTPLMPVAREAMEAWLRRAVGNASSLHADGRAARRAVEDAREEVAALLGGEPREIVFTSGATEANNLALLPPERLGRDEGHLAVSAIEHPSVLACRQRWEAAGGRTTLLPVDGSGRLELAALDRVLRQGVDQVAVMAASNEVGTLQPWREIAARCRDERARLHVDAVQVVGKVPFSVAELGPLGTASVSAHKLGGPTGAGALWTAPERPLTPLLLGGGQERDRRAGTENVVGIVGFAAACREIRKDPQRQSSGRQYAERLFIGELQKLLPDVMPHGADEDGRVPGILSLHFPGVAGEALLFALDLAGVSVSLGSACSSGAALPSHVLTAMGISKVDNLESLRFSFGFEHTECELRAAADLVAKTALACRK